MWILRKLGIRSPSPPALRVESPCPDILAAVAATGGLSDRGLPLVRLGLTFARRAGTTNPDMAVALLVDRGGALPARREGHAIVDAFGATPPYFASTPAQIVHGVAAFGGSCDLVFYDSEVAVVGAVRTMGEYDAAFRSHPPRGQASYIPPAVEGAFLRAGPDRGVYVLVFSKETRADGLCILHDQVHRVLSAAAPAPRRVHIVGADASMHRGDRLQIQRAFSRVPNIGVRYQNGYVEGGEGPRPDPSLFDHVLRFMEPTVFGIGEDVRVAESVAPGGTGTLLRVGNVSSGRWYDGPQCAVGFVPLAAQLALEVAASHPPALDIVIDYHDGVQRQRIPLHIPIPAVSA